MGWFHDDVFYFFGESLVLVILPSTGKTFVFEERYKGAP
jgi:hypothetical protein